MDREEALRRLPRAYRIGLRLRDLGADAGLIAECLDIEPEAVEPLIAIAEAKLVDLGMRPAAASAPADLTGPPPARGAEPESA